MVHIILLLLSCVFSFFGGGGVVDGMSHIAMIENWPMGYFSMGVNILSNTSSYQNLDIQNATGKEHEVVYGCLEGQFRSYRACISGSRLKETEPEP